MNDEIQLAITKQIMEIINKIDATAQERFPIIAGQMVRDIFDTQGAATGRNWKPNTKDTVRIKGFNQRNKDTGLLEDALSQPGFILDDNYMENLPTRTIKGKQDKDGYKWANKIDDYANRFDNLGRTENDEAYILEKLVKEIANDF